MLQRIVRFMSSQSRPEPFLTTAEIISKRPLNHDCYLYQIRFSDKPFDLRIGEHFRFAETIKTFDAPEGEEIIRKYTPISPLSQKVSLPYFRMSSTFSLKYTGPMWILSFPMGVNSLPTSKP